MPPSQSPGWPLRAHPSASLPSTAPIPPPQHTRPWSGKSPNKGVNFKKRVSCRGGGEREERGEEGKKEEEGEEEGGREEEGGAVFSASIFNQ